MASDEVLARIAAWEAAGLIDPEIAARLRAAEAAERAGAVGPAAMAAPAAAAPGGGSAEIAARSAVAAAFGPPPSIVELFAYLGSGFVLAAWHVLSSTGGDNPLEWIGPAIALALIGVVLGRGDERQRRAAGVAFAAATAHVFVGTQHVLDPSGPELGFMIAGAAATLAAVAFRRWLPAVLTQLALLGALVLLAASALNWLGLVLLPSPEYIDFSGVPPSDPNGVVRAILSAAWWIAWAVGFGALGLWEARRAGAAVATDPDLAAAGWRRSAATRVVAGLTIVIGAASAIMTRSYLSDGSYDRVLPAWAGDGLLLVIALGLLGLAIRRGATAYLYPAALGLIVALTDANGTYVAEQTGIALALLVEGVILIGAGFSAERLRRRVIGGPPAPGPRFHDPDDPGSADEAELIELPGTRAAS
ncbi:MAG TPA: hypothetical protein VGI98_08150 [Candidatus Limnocylindrales bacterium]